MIGFVKGEVSDIGDDYAIIDVNGIGMIVYCTSQALVRMRTMGGSVKLFTYMNVKEDSMTLYGFFHQEDLEFFKLLITVNGIGPKAGLSILNTISPKDLRFAILAEDKKAIAQAPGVGTKTASRIILDLKDKISVGEAFQVQLSQEDEGELQEDAKAEAVQALTALGYGQAESLKAVKNVELKAEMTTEDVLKAALKYLL